MQFYALFFLYTMRDNVILEQSLKRINFWVCYKLILNFYLDRSLVRALTTIERLEVLLRLDRAQLNLSLRLREILIIVSNEGLWVLFVLSFWFQNWAQKFGLP